MPTNERYYPMGSIAAHILGGVQKDGHRARRHRAEVRETARRARTGSKRTLKDARRRPIAVAAEDYLPPQHGQHLILTIDANIQMIAEQELAAHLQEFKAKRGEVVVMDPQDRRRAGAGELADVQPAESRRFDARDVRRNRCLTDPYEPGSTIKPFIAGPALQWNITRPTKSCRSPARTTTRRYGRSVVTDVHGYDQLAHRGMCW